MKIFKNTFPLHKLYGFLLLNTSLIVFTPVMMILINTNNFEIISFEIIISFALSLCGIILSILFIFKKKIAIHLLTILLVATISLLTIYLLFILSESPGDTYGIILMLNAFGFFIVEGILGLLIIHSNKLSDEFENYD